MKKIKIEKEVTKEDVFVCVPEESLKDVIGILEASGEDYESSYVAGYNYLRMDLAEQDWFFTERTDIGRRTEITIPQLAELLGVEYPLKPEQLPTLEELIAEAKSKITVKSETYPCWVDGMREIKVYRIGDTSYMSEKSAIAAYISKKIREEYL